MDIELLEVMSESFDLASDAVRPGGELFWFACDSDEHLALFCTAGFGYVPEAVFSDKNAYVALLSLFVKGELAHRCGIEIDVSAPRNYVHDLDDEKEFGEKGLFYYDHPSIADEAYIRLVLPHRPLLVSQLPSMHIDYMLSLKMLNTRFETAQKFRPEAYFDCR